MTHCSNILHTSFGAGQGSKEHSAFTKGGDGEKGHLEEQIKREKWKLSNIENNPEYNDGIREDIRNRLERLNDDPKVRQKSIDLLKGRLDNQITGIKEIIAKVLDRDTSLAGEQGIMIASILMAIGITISVLVEALFPGGMAAQGGAAGKGGVGQPENVKERLRNKLNTLALLLGTLGPKEAKALPGNHQLDPQQGKRGSGLGVTKPMGIGLRCWRVASYIHGHEKVTSFP